MNTKPDSEDQLTLELLDVIEKQSDLSQRHLATHLGVALGLANSYLKRCARKGYIKITKAPANRYLYYLTPKGFTEKARLTAQYLSYSLSFYREASDSCAHIFQLCKQQGWNRILLCGVSDLAEIAALRAMEMGIEIVGVYDVHTERQHFIGKPVWHNLESAAPYDACMLTDIHAPRTSYQNLIKTIDAKRVLVPSILKLETSQNTG